VFPNLPTGGENPPIAKAAVLVPAPVVSLAVFKEVTGDQLVPFQDSVFAT